jgi:hypothetical protein
MDAIFILLLMLYENCFHFFIVPKKLYKIWPPFLLKLINIINIINSYSVVNTNLCIYLALTMITLLTLSTLQTILKIISLIKWVHQSTKLGSLLPAIILI